MTTSNGKTAMPNLGPMEILVVLAVALIVLGPKRLPEAGRQVGRAIGEVKRWSESMQAEVKAVLEDDVEAPPPAPWVSPLPRSEENGAEPPVAEPPDALPSPDEVPPGEPEARER